VPSPHAPETRGPRTNVSYTTRYGRPGGCVAEGESPLSLIVRRGGGGNAGVLRGGSAHAPNGARPFRGTPRCAARHTITPCQSVPGRLDCFTSPRPGRPAPGHRGRALTVRISGVTFTGNLHHGGAIPGPRQGHRSGARADRNGIKRCTVGVPPSGGNGTDRHRGRRRRYLIPRV